MKRLLALVVVMACGGPTQQQLAETPTAKTRATPPEAPAASTSDKDREGLRQSFDDMESTQRARREAEQGSAAPRGKHLEYPPEETPPKQGPAVEAPKKQGPAEQAPSK